MSMVKKWRRWGMSPKRTFKRRRKFKLIIIKDGLRGAKKPPDWLMELQEPFATGTDAKGENDKTA